MRAGRGPKIRVLDRGAGRRIAGVVLLLFVASSARAFDLTGAGSIFLTSTDDQGIDSENQQDRLSLNLAQRFTPYVNAVAGYQYFRQTLENDLGADNERRSRTPFAELLYNRERLSARVAVREQTTDGTTVNDNFVIDSLSASVAWAPRRGPSMSLSFRDESNVADVAVFGRNIDSRYLNFDTSWDASWGGASYGFQRTELDNKGAGLETDQNRHDLRGYTTTSFFSDRLTLDVVGMLSRMDRDTKLGDTPPEFAEPVRASRGLYVIDPAPDIGELDSTPGLIDGNTTVPSAPGIDIGGANTYRNIGVELQVRQQVSRLEITVDALSDPGLVWAVYISPDNLVWEPFVLEASVWDAALLRYTLFFPQVTERYFKAVNVSVNDQPTVRVTEVRALLEVNVAEDRVKSDLYRADVALGFQPGGRVSGRVNVGFSNDETVSAGLVRRKFEEIHAGATFSADLDDELRLDLGFRYNDTENGREPVLFRTEYTYNAGLNWTPLPTLDGALLANRRDEEEQGELLQSTRSLRLLIGTVFLPDLRLISDVAYTRTDDPFQGFDREGLTWRETLETNITPRWSLRLSYGRASYESRGADDLDRDDVTVYSRWSPTLFFTLTGSWSLYHDDRERSVRQNYGINYTPGPKLNISASYQENDNEELTKTTSDSVSLNYRISRRLTVFGNLSHSKSRLSGVNTGDVTSVRSGLRFAI